MIDKVREAVIRGDLRNIRNEVREAVYFGATPEGVIEAMTEAMNEVGEAFSRGDIFISEMMLAAKTMQRGIGVLRPAPAGEDATPKGTLAVGTVQGDLHDIGKNMVAMLAEGAGYEVIDLGVDVTAEKYLQLLREHPDCRVIALSALLTSSLDNMKQIAERVRAEFPDVKLIVGGAPVTEAFAEELGADIFTNNAATTVMRLDELMAEDGSMRK